MNKKIRNAKYHAVDLTHETKGYDKVSYGAGWDAAVEYLKPALEYIQDQYSDSPNEEMYKILYDLGFEE